jgi:hypothetical protein
MISGPDDGPGLFGSLNILEQGEIRRSDSPFFSEEIEANDPAPVGFAKERSGILYGATRDLALFLSGNFPTGAFTTERGTASVDVHGTPGSQQPQRHWQTGQILCRP